MKIALLLIPIILAMLLMPGNVSAPTSRNIRTATIQPNVIVPQLTFALLSTVISGCSQVANVNSTWMGPLYFIVVPASFFLVIRQTNAVYGNTTNVVNPNNNVGSWYLFQNIPITLKLSFISCTSITFESLYYADGVQTIKIA